MFDTITISAKRQITIPARLFERFGLSRGGKLVVNDEDGFISLTPAEQIVEDLSGSVELPQKLKKKSMDEVIRIARSEYFNNKSNIKV